MKQLNVGRFVAAALAVFAALFTMEFLIHHLVFGPILEPAMKNLKGWRTEEEMMSGRYGASMIAGYVVYCVLFVWVYHWGWTGRKWEGVRYGIYAWLFTMLPWILWWYSFQPVGTFVPYWIASGLVQFPILGLLVGAIYKPKESAV